MTRAEFAIYDRQARRALRGFPGLAAADVDELVQEAIATVAELAKRPGDHNPVAFVRTVAWRRARDRVRDRRRELLVDETVIAYLRERQSSADVVDEVLDREAVATFRVAAGALRERERRVARLRLELGVEPREVRRLLDLSPKSYEKALTAARRELQAGVAAWR